MKAPPRHRNFAIMAWKISCLQLEWVGMRKQFTVGETSEIDSDDPRLMCRRIARLAGFHEAYREPVQALSCMSQRVEELAESFPALLFALATGYGTAAQRSVVFEMILDGAPLRETAAAFDLPLWLRKLPPQTFTDPIRRVPGEAAFSRTIINLIPKSPSACTTWFERACDAYCIGGADYMLWIARQKRLPFAGDGRDSLILMGAWVWASLHPDSLAHSMVRLPWSGEMSIKRAFDEARAWERRADLAITLGSGTPDGWFQGATVNGFDFVPVRTIDEFLAESEAMGNCLDQYADSINNSHVRVFSIRKDGERIADLEIAPHDDDCLMPAIEQLRGPRNNRAAPEIWQAAYAWLGAQTFRVFPGPSHGGRSEIGAVWERLWEPIVEDIAHIPLRKRLRNFARQAHGAAGVQREAGRVGLNI